MKRICILILLSVFLLSGCGSATVVYDAPELIDPVQAQPKTDTVRREDLMDVSILTGNVAVHAEPVSFIIDGTLGKLYVVPGQEVKKGDVLAELDTESLQTQLDTLLKQQETTGYTNALTNENLQIDVDICQLKLDQLTRTQEAALSVQTDTLTTLQAALAQLQQSNANAIAALEQQISALQTQLTAPELSDTDKGALLTEINALEDQRENLKSKDRDTAASAETEIKAVQEKIDALKAQQALERKLRELDLQDAQLAAKHAKQTQAHAAKQVNVKIELLQAQIAKSTITAHMDGVVTWISDATRISAEKAFLYIADPNRRFVRTEEFSDNQLKSAEQLYAVINGQQYNLIYRPWNVDERIYMSLNSIPIFTLYDFEDGVQVPESANALVYCVSGYRENALSIPETALNRDGNGYFVYRMEDGQKQQVYIKIGISTQLRVEVISGLEEGDVVYVTE